MTNSLLYSTLLSEDPTLGPLVSAFVDDLQPAQCQLVSLLQTVDLSGIQYFAHTWRGASGTYGFDALSHAADELERAVSSPAISYHDVVLAATRFLYIARQVRSGFPS